MLSRRHFSEGILTALINLGTTNELQDDTAASIEQFICAVYQPRVVVSTAAFHARVRGSVPGLGGLKETKKFFPHPRVKVSIVGSLRDREVACSASDRQGSNFESCVWRTVSSQSSHHPQEVLLAQFSLYVHKGGLKPDSFHLFTTSPYCLSEEAAMVVIQEETGRIREAASKSRCPATGYSTRPSPGHYLEPRYSTTACDSTPRKLRVETGG